MTAEPPAKRPRAKKTPATPPTPSPELETKSRPEILGVAVAGSSPPKVNTAPEEAISEQEDLPSRPQPIPPPSERMQYRAIGVVRGRYVPASEEEFNRGVMMTEDGVEIETVLLGQVMNLIKKYLDLNEPHLWVVYPRTRDVDKEAVKLHLQIVGVWEPERLQQANATAADPGVNDGYFSVRGEVIFNSQEKNFVVVKIQQLPRRRGEKPKAFKLKLTGTVPMKSPGYFWDFQVQRQGTSLVVQEAATVGILPPRKIKKPKKAKARPARPQRPQRPGSSTISPRPTPFRPVRRSPNPPLN
ncbi:MULTISPECIES: hypothetical protein [unclassified Thermosynechococcus]|uniref:hypothetical protein n=1 Tax=unclassified Thermosynechococcus TaxID=2622553 RepID=UPI001CEDE02E|nr:MULTISPECIES: hypothetical protein [unclassified Thermosynechococcus]WNC31652.1 hypothetical protein RHH81_08335 [Thermosynechococcus sp. PKX95]WNC34176.1 hypothetical protein RHH79_08330 [Thermosynechococcus sp. PKX91]WNC36699.1 hypothetical protein RHI11_08325 [Thermosynechococcus sp. WL11]WNC39220.1 hypothetical protein RHI18_08325 [Thermosynechococcus sp. WL17]WNC41741.1 hypothetical protein RHI14_08315 [Thermosynechococcus sp. WL15]